MSRWNSGWVAAVIIVLSGPGCSTFNRDWKTTAARPATTGLEGRWQGTWRSESTKHTGGLRCLITRRDHELYQARFRATFAGIVPFESAVDLRAKGRGGSLEFSGQSTLPAWAGGRYDYAGKADRSTFSSTYKSGWDHGVFEMTRVKTLK